MDNFQAIPVTVKLFARMVEMFADWLGVRPPKSTSKKNEGPFMQNCCTGLVAQPPKAKRKPREHPKRGSKLYIQTQYTIVLSIIPISRQYT